MQKNFPERLSALLSERGISQAELSRLAKVDKAYISNLLSGNKSNPSAEYVKRLAEALEVNSRWLEYGEGDKMFSSDVVRETPAKPILATQIEIQKLIREGPAGAARRMEPAELIERINEHADKLITDHPYMVAAHCEIIIALASELYLRPPNFDSQPRSQMQSQQQSQGTSTP